MPTVDDTQMVGGAADKTKQELQQALLDLLKGNPEILNSVTQTTNKQGGHATAEAQTRSGDEDGRRTQKSPSTSFPEDENRLNQPRRGSYQWQFSDSDDGIDSAWTTATKNMSPRELNKWRRSLFSVYAGHLPYDITRKELVQLFSEVGNVQDAHLQPAKEGTHTYGFVRYLTLEECSDAVSMLHGRLLGNRTITVEYACETKERLQGSDPSDLPLDKKDKLLRNDYPKADHFYRPMSDAESQEKMILWKLRCSATRQKSNEQESKEELMSKIQEIVKKVASLPEEKSALPSGSEGSSCSPWILQEINGNYISGEKAQPHHMRCTDKHKEPHTVLNNTEPQITGAPSKVAVKHSPNITSTSIKKEHVHTQMLTESQEPTPVGNAVTFSHPPDTQKVLVGPFEDTLSSVVPCSPGTDDSSPNKMEATARNSLSSPERSLMEHCQFCHSLSHSQEHASESSQSESTSSLSSRQSPTTPGTFCQEREGNLSEQDDCSPLAKQGSLLSVNQSRDMGLCSFESDNDYVTKNSDLYKRSQKQRPFSPETHQPKQVPMPSQCRNQEQMHVINQSNRSFTQQRLPHDSKNTGLLKEGLQQAQYSSKTPEPKQASVSIQYTNQEQTHVTHQSNRSFAHHGHLTDPPYTKNSDLLKEGKKQMQHSSEPASTWSPFTDQAQMHFTDPSNRPFAHQGILYGQPNTSNTNRSNRSFAHNGKHSSTPHAINTGLAKEDQKEMQQLSDIPKPKQAPLPQQFTNQEQMNTAGQANKPFSDLRKENQAQAQYSSEIPQAKPAFVPTKYPNERSMSVHLANQGIRPQQSLQSDPHVSEKSHLLKEGQKKMQSLLEVPQAKQAFVSSLHPNQEQIRANRPISQQSLLYDPAFASFLGQPQHIQAMLANMIASGWQQPGFPRHPLLAPGAMNLLLQQQFLAARMQGFGSPFHAGGHQRVGFGMRGPVRPQGQGYRMPFGRTGMGPMGRGRSFAPRFYNPGAENVKTHGESEKSVPGVSRTVSSERNLPVDKNILEACGDKVQHSSLAANDSLQSSVRLPINPTSPENIKVELTTRESSTPRPSQERPTPKKHKGISPISEAAISPPGSNLPREEGDLESPRTNKTSPSKLSQSELLLKEEREELKRIVRENERLRQCIDWRSSGRTATTVSKENRETLRADIHNKEVQLQKEKEIVMARKAEQELLYERAKLEAAFDQQLKRELEEEKKLGETKNKIHLARLENDLLRSYQDLHGTINDE